MIAIFGYGSLVHTGTHAHAARPAIAHGWRRIWREVAGQDQAILSVRPDPAATLQGAVIFVPPDDLPALDVRETSYERTAAIVTDMSGTPFDTAQIYVVAPHEPTAAAPILRSYLDVVLAGFEAQFGPEAGRDFYASTDGWHLDVNNDRAAPQYPRAQPMTARDAARYDALHSGHAL